MINEYFLNNEYFLEERYVFSRIGAVDLWVLVEGDDLADDAFGFDTDLFVGKVGEVAFELRQGIGQTAGTFVFVVGLVALAGRDEHPVAGLL